MFVFALIAELHVRHRCCSCAPALPWRLVGLLFHDGFVVSAEVGSSRLAARFLRSNYVLSTSQFQDRNTHDEHSGGAASINMRGGGAASINMQVGRRDETDPSISQSCRLTNTSEMSSERRRNANPTPPSSVLV